MKENFNNNYNNPLNFNYNYNKNEKFNFSINESFNSRKYFSNINKRFTLNNIAVKNSNIYNNIILKKKDKINIKWNSNYIITKNNFIIFELKSIFTENTKNIKNLFYNNLKINKFELCDCNGSKTRSKVCSEFRIIINLINNYIHYNKWINLLKECKNYKIKNQKIIEKDIPRTFGNHSFYKNENVKINLNDILKFFANKNNGFYVQGMNFIGGSLLLHLDPEFVLLFLNYIFNDLELNILYSDNLEGLFIHNKIVFNILKKVNSKLYILFINNNILPEIFLTEWFMTLATYKIPLTHHKMLFYGILKFKWDFIYSLIIEFYNILTPYFMKFSDTDLIVEVKNIDKKIQNENSDLFDWTQLIKKCYSKENIDFINKNK